MDPTFLLFLLITALAGVVWKSRPVFSNWLHVRRCGVALSFFRICRMFFSNVPLKPVLDAHVAAVRAGVSIDLDEIIAHAMAGGDTRAVVYAFVETRRAGTAIDFADVCELELSEPDPEEILVP
jgi:uncharacterized protein YqfA (UPF0365 family)